VTEDPNVTMRNIRQNLFLAFVYNAVGVPIAAGVLYPWLGLLISPIWASGRHDTELGVGDWERVTAAEGPLVTAPLPWGDLSPFSGSRFNSPRSERDWILRILWVSSMDALAAGLIVIVLGSYYMWWRLKPKRRVGVLVLTAGMLSCGAFLAGVF
jgi:hypothetical protein